MFSSLRERFGTAGLVVAVIALIAAVAGTAIAAGGLTKSQEKQVKKIAKKYAGKQGPVGPQGPVGSNGAAGANGKDGAPGQTGATGPAGADGISPKGTAFAGEANGCQEGGVKFTGVNVTAACNGLKGADGETGFTETLPSGKTETGTWAAGYSTVAETQFVPLSFNIPLSEPPVIKYNTPSTEQCPGTAAEPKAKAGFLCVYLAEKEGTVSNEEFLNFAFTTGAVLGITLVTAESFALGTWAVTAD